MNKPALLILPLLVLLSACENFSLPGQSGPSAAPAETPTPTFYLTPTITMSAEEISRWNGQVLDGLEKAVEKAGLLPVKYMLDGPYFKVDSYHPQDPDPSVYVGYSITSVDDPALIGTVNIWYFLDPSQAAMMMENLRHYENLPWDCAEQQVLDGEKLFIISNPSAAGYGYISGFLANPSEGGYILEIILMYSNLDDLGDVFGEYAQSILEEIHALMVDYP
jgi:hypothetical protein